MYRIQQQLVSWVCSRIADIAEIDPENVAPSLMSGCIQLTELKLRVATLNKILPIKIDHGTIGSLQVSIPWLTLTVHPLEIHVDGACITLSVAQGRTPSESTMEERLERISNESVLGIHQVGLPDDDDRTSKHLTRQATSHSDGSHSDGDDDDDDFHSCKSDSDTESSGSDSDDEASLDETATSAKRGILHAVMSNAMNVAQYVAPSAWTAPRPVCLLLRNCRIVAPCDERQGLSIEASVTSMKVEIDPTEETSPNVHVKVVKITIDGAALHVKTPQNDVQIGFIPKVEIVVTTTTNRQGTVVAKNTSITQGDEATLTFSESSIDLVARCIVAKNLLERVPLFARHLVPLRRHASLWPFAIACVLTMITDRKRRWNFNASHIRTFTIARRQYLELLEQCHRYGSVELQREALAIAEGEIVYRDVVEALRSIAQAKFRRQSAPTSSSEVTAIKELAVSMHCTFTALRVCLPSETSVRVTGITVVKRQHDTQIAVKALRISQHGVATHDYISAGTMLPESHPCVSISVRDDASRQSSFVSVNVQPIQGHMKLLPLLESFRPVIACTSQILRSLPLSENSKTSEVKSSKQNTTAIASRRTHNIHIHGVALGIEEFVVTVSKLSISQTSSESDGYSHDVSATTLTIGCEEISMMHVDRYVLHPLSIRTVDKLIEISPVRLVWSEEAHQHVMEAVCLIKAELLLFETESTREIPLHVHSKPTTSQQLELGQLLERQTKVPRHGLTICCDSISLELVPMKCIISVQDVTVRSCSIIVPDGLKAPLSGSVVDVRSLSTSVGSSPLQICCMIEDMRVILGAASRVDLRSAASVAMQRVSVAICDNAVNFLEAAAIRVAACAGELVMESRSASVLGASIGIAPLKVAIFPNRFAISNEFAPFNASNVNIMANVYQVHVGKASENKDVAMLSKFIWEVAVPIAKRFMSEQAQRLFQNGLSDLNVQLTLCDSENHDLPAEIIIGSDVSVFSWMSFVQPPRRPSSRWSSKSLTESSPGLTRYQHASPYATGIGAGFLSVTNDCSALAIIVSLPAISLSISDSKCPMTSVDVVVESLQVQIPMTPLPFWTDPSLVVVAPINSKASIHRMTAAVNLRQELDAASWASLVSSGSALLSLSIENFAKEDFASRNETPASSSSDRAEDEDVISDVALQRTQITLGKLRCGLDVKDSNLIVKLITKVQLFTDKVKASSKNITITSSCFERTFSQQHDDTRVRVVAANKLVLIERCTFHLIDKIAIAPSTTCVLRNCTIHCSGDNDSVIVLEDATAAYVMENCNFVSLHQTAFENPTSTESPIQSALANQAISVEIDTAVVGVHFRHVESGATVVLHKISFLHKSLGDSTRSVSLHLHRMAAQLSVSGHDTEVIERSTLVVDGSYRQMPHITEALGVVQLFVRLTSTPVRIPIVSLSSFVAGIRSLSPLKELSTGNSKPASNHPQSNIEANLRDLVTHWMWRIDVSAPLLELDCCLPNDLSILSIAINNASLSSHRHSISEKAVVHASMTVRGSVWDPLLCASCSFIKEPMTTSTTVEVTPSVSTPLSLCVDFGALSFHISDDAVRSLLSMTSYLLPDARRSVATFTAPIVIRNTVGCPIHVKLGGCANQLTVIEHLADAKVRLQLPFAFRLNSMTNFVEVHSFDVRSKGDDATVACQQYGTKEIHIGGGLSVSISLEVDTALGQQLTFSTMCQVKNMLFDLSVLINGQHIGSTHANSATVASRSKGSVPISLLDDACVTVTLIRSDGKQSTAVSIDDSSPRCIAQRAVNEGAAALGRRMLFNFGDEIRMIDLSFDVDRSRGGLVEWLFCSGRPTIINHLTFPMRVSMFAAQDGKVPFESFTVDVGAVGLLDHLRDDSIFIEISADIPSGLYVCSERINIDDLVMNGSEVSMVMLHSSRGMAQCFELTLLPQMKRGVNLISIACTQGFLLANYSGESVELLSGLGGTIGTSGDVELVPVELSDLTCDKTVSESVYLPFDNPFVISTRRSDPSSEITVTQGAFEKRAVISKIDCDADGEAAAALCLYLIGNSGPVPGIEHIDDEGWRSELESRCHHSVSLMPSLVIVNRCSAEISVQHSIFSDKDGSNNMEFVEKISVECSVAHSVVALERFNETFSFSRDETFWSPPIRMDFLSNTTESFVIRLSASDFCRITAFKNEVCEPAELVIGPFCDAPLFIRNLSLFTFQEVPSLSCASLCPAPRQTELLLHVAHGTTPPISISLTHEGKFAVAEPHVSVAVSIIGDRTFVTIAHPSTSSAVASHLDQNVVETAQSMPLKMSLKLRQATFEIMSLRKPLVSLCIDSVNLWISRQSSMWSAEYGISNFAVWANDQEAAVIRPVSLDMFFSDVAFDTGRVIVKNIRVHSSKIELTLSNDFLTALKRFGRRCALSPANKRFVWKPTTDHSRKPQPHVKIFVRQVCIAESRLVFSWSRGNTDQQELLGDFILRFLVGSVTAASIILPTFQRETRDQPDEIATVMAYFYQHCIKALIAHSAQLASSMSPFGSPFSWAGSIVSGVSSALSSDFVRKSFRAPLSLFVTEMSTSTSSKDSSYAESDEPMRPTGSWICCHCAKVHHEIISGLPLADILTRYGPAALAHHTSQRERVHTLIASDASLEDIVLGASIDLSLGRSSTWRQDPAVALDSQSSPEYIVAHFPLHVLCGASRVGLLPPLSDALWRKVVTLVEQMTDH